MGVKKETVGKGEKVTDIGGIVKRKRAHKEQKREIRVAERRVWGLWQWVGFPEKRNQTKAKARGSGEDQGVDTEKTDHVLKERKTKPKGKRKGRKRRLVNVTKKTGAF